MVNGECAVNLNIFLKKKKSHSPGRGEKGKGKTEGPGFQRLWNKRRISAGEEMLA